MPPDPNDFTAKYNTKLSPSQEREFQAKYPNTKDLYDYDLRGAFKAGAAKAANGHLPDTFKKPNHPTFSTESQYSGKDGYTGGTWSQRLGPVKGWNYTASPTNAQFHGVSGLNDYFKQREPDSTLILAPVLPQVQ